MWVAPMLKDTATWGNIRIILTCILVMKYGHRTKTRLLKTSGYAW